MLILRRLLHEALVVVCPDGSRLRFTIKSVGMGACGPQVRVGVDAPTSYAIHRAEALASAESTQHAGRGTQDEPLSRDAGEAALGEGGSRVPLLALGPDSTDRLSHRPTGS